MARNSASRIVSWPSRARSKTISVTASLGSFALTRGRERVLRELFFLPERLEAALFALRLAIMAGIVLQLEKTTSGFELTARIRPPREEVLFLGELAAGGQVVKIENGVQHERIRAVRLAAVDRIDGEEHDMAAA